MGFKTTFVISLLLAGTFGEAFATNGMGPLMPISAPDQGTAPPAPQNPAGESGGKAGSGGVDPDKFDQFIREVRQAQKDAGGQISADQVDQIRQKLDINADSLGDYLEQLRQTNPNAFPPSGQAPAQNDPDAPQNGVQPVVAPSPDEGPASTGYYGVLNAVNNQAVSANPKNPNARARRGLGYLWQGQNQLAFNDLGAAISGGVKSKEVLTAYGQSALQLGDYPLAASAAQEVLKSYPGDQAALAIYHSAVDKAPTVNLPSSLGALADSRSSGAMPFGADGSGAFSNGSVSAPPPSGMTADQAAALAKEAKAPGSDLPKRSAQFTQDAANVMRMKDYPKAYELASEAVRLNPQNVQALNYRAMALSHMRRYPEAMQDVNSALGAAPGNAGVLGTRSWILSKQGRYKEGLQDAEAALAADPSNGYLNQQKAFALAGLGNRAGAVDALRKLAAFDPHFQTQLERALQLPQDSDMTLLFDDGSTAAAAAPPPGAQQRRFLRLTVLSAVGGLLIALGVIHIVSAGWREKMRLTVRRALGSSPTVAAERAPAVSPSQGSFWTQYHLVKEIGLGGMGVVYEAMDRSLERRVAVKKMRDEIRLEPHDRQRFINEARLVAQLHHPSIVDIYGIVEDGTDVYLVFEYVEGRTLQDVLKSDGPLELPRARAVLKDMAEAVAHAHGRGIIHRDLKPSNVMITPERRVKVMDFGVARQAKDALTRHSLTNTIVGTPPYMAPEQEQGTVRKESDVYALGVCLYEMTTGFLPFTGSGAAMLLNKLNGKLIPATQRVPSLPAGFDAVIAKALAPDPDQRYRTPAELVSALDSLLAPTA